MAKRAPNKIIDYKCACGQEFTLKKKKATGDTVRCPGCVKKDANTRAREAKYYKRPGYASKNRAADLKRLYNLSVSDYEQLVESQGGVCAICKLQKPLVVDHDHNTGLVRGLLCQECNRAIGVFKDSPPLLQSAVSYLRKAHRGSWDDYFVSFARLAATRSKDKSSQVGAVIVQDRRILSTGYNGFPRGVNDDIPERHERPAKYLWTVHAEENAILNAARHGVKIIGASMYVTPFNPCMDCAKSIVSAGLIEVVVDDWQENPRFLETMVYGKQLFQEVGVVMRTRN